MRRLVESPEQALSDWLHDPFVQSGAMPFAAGLAAAVLLFPVRLAGLAGIAGFATAVWLIGNFSLQPLSASRKLVLLIGAAALAGAAFDLVRASLGTQARIALGVLCGAGAVWMVWTVLVQKPAGTALAIGAGGFALVGWLASGMSATGADPLRAGAASLALTFGAGVAAMLGGSALLAQYGIALGAACGAFLLVAVLRGGRPMPCVALATTAGAGGGLLAFGAAVVAHLSWLALLPLALVPLAVRLPLPGAAPAWLRAGLATLYAATAAAAACGVAWWASRGG
jgi:hypothetical protein